MSGVDEATRGIQWNVGPEMVAFMYVSMATALVVFAYGWWRIVSVWLLGRPEVRWDRPLRRLRSLAPQVLGHRKLLRQVAPGVFHAQMAFGSLTLLAATLVVFVQSDLGLEIMKGPFYLYFQSAFVDVSGALATAGVAFYLGRHLLRRARGRSTASAGDLLLLGGGLSLLLSGFAIEGIRLVVTRDAWAGWSPVGSAFGAALGGLGGERELRAVHAGLWVLHLGMWHVLMAAIPFTRLRHAVLAPANIFFSDAHRTGALPDLDLESPEVRLGIRSPLDLSWKQLMDLDTCTECGRCTDVCPAANAGKPLSPKRVVVDLRDAVHRSRRLLRAGASAAGPERRAGPPLAGTVVPAEALWACTTCRACEEACPVGIEHVGLIVQLRRDLAMEQGEVPAGVAAALGSLEKRKHPFRSATGSRDSWHAGLEVKLLAEVGDASKVEIVYWVGCAVVANPRVRSVARSLATVLDHAGVSFAILGAEEGCTGDVARRTGNEIHYDELARANIDLLRRYGVRRVVTHCAHCLQTLKNDYRERGLELEVLHHTELMDALVREGRLRIAPALRGAVTFHDPCYLGRYNRAFAAPRDLIDRLGTDRVEMAESGASAMCCGAGGGHAFYEDPAGERISGRRAAQALATGAKTVCTACPFCLEMLEDGLAGRADVRVRDIAELVAETFEHEAVRRVAAEP